MLVWQASLKEVNLSPEFAMHLKAAYYTAIGDAELHQSELAAVLRALDLQCITPVLFKGAALAFTVYPDPACRPMGDLDLWVTDAEMPKAQAALEAIGYQFAAKSDRPPALMRMYMGEVALHGRRPGTGLVELHWGVFPGEWLRRTAAIDEDAVRARVQPVRVADQPAWILAAEDSIIQLAVHFAVNHQLAYPWLRGLVDVTLLARHQPIDWNLIVARARAWRVATATWLVLKLTVELTGLHEAVECVRQLSPSPLRRWLIGRFANADGLVAMHDLSRSRWRFVYLLLLVDRLRDAARLVYRAVWPEDEWLTARYGQAGFKRRVQHLLSALRGRI